MSIEFEAVMLDSVLFYGYKYCLGRMNGFDHTLVILLPTTNAIPVSTIYTIGLKVKVISTYYLTSIQPKALHGDT
jgi:hypothetical protein